MTAVAIALWSVLAQARDVCGGIDVRRSDDGVGPALVVEAAVGTLEVVDGTPRLRQEFVEAGHRQESLPAGLEVIWTLADDSRVEMTSADTAEAVSLTYGSETALSTATRWTLQFVLTEPVVHAMARSPSTRIRYTLLSDARDIEVQRAAGVRVQKLFACFANEWSAE